MHDGGAIETRCRKRLVECGRDVGGTHCGTQPPGHDVAREVVEHGREVVPAPASDLEVGEVGLPELVAADAGVIHSRHLHRQLPERLLAGGTLLTAFY